MSEIAEDLCAAPHAMLHTSNRPTSARYGRRSPRPILLAALGLALSVDLATGAAAQTSVSWEASAGLTPAEDVPRWDAFLGEYATGSNTCDLASETLGPTSLLVDTTACASDVGLYRGGSVLGGYPTPPTHFVEGVLRIRSSLGASVTDGPAALSLTVPLNCTWAVHVDVNQVLLHHGDQVVATATMPTTTTARRYRLEVDPAARFARVYVDGLLRFSYDASADPACAPASFRWVLFGDLSYDEGGRVEWLSVSHDISNGFATFCEAQPNSLGYSPYLIFGGSRSVAMNSMELRVWDLPVGAFGYFLCSRSHAPAFFAPGSQGTLCLGGAVGRFARTGEVVQVPASGNVAFPIDLTDLPQPSGAVSGLPGDEWNFQFWYRDANPAPTSNLSGGLQVNLQ